MNVHANPQRTAAETALIDAFGKRLSDLPGDASVALRRDAAIETLKRGLPTRRMEAWHYTDLRRLLTAVPGFSVSSEIAATAALVEGSTVLLLRNGRGAEVPPLAEGLAAERLEGRLIDGAIAPSLSAGDAADAVGSINTAFVTDGWSVEIAAGAQIAAPVEIQNLHGGGQAHVRLDFRAGAGSKATIVERQTGDAAALVSSVSHVTVGDGAEVTWVIVQEQPQDTTHLGQFNAEIGRDAQLRVFVMNTGGKLVRQEIRVAVRGEGSDFQLRAVNLLGGDTHTDVTMELQHLVEDTSSVEIVRNVLTDRARGVFQGQIRVAAVAQKTDARMACNTLLLSDDAEFSTKPELEIFADDVACGHGATVTEIDRDHLFYLMARCVPEKEARRLLVKAFVAEIIEEMEDERLVEALEEKLDSWFATHG